MKVLFLDIDGVLNSRNYIKRKDVDFDNPSLQIDPDAVVRLNAITKLAGAVIVLTSTWRLAFDMPSQLARMQECLASYNITASIIDRTGVQDSGRRYEIQEWLDMNPGVESYVILDDEIIEGFSGHTVRTFFDYGLQDEHVRQALTILDYK